MLTNKIKYLLATTYDLVKFLLSLHSEKALYQGNNLKIGLIVSNIQYIKIFYIFNISIDRIFLRLTHF